MSDVGSRLRVFPVARNDSARPEVRPAEARGQAIIVLLEQVAEAALRNEERAKASAQHLADELRKANDRANGLEGQIRDLRSRAEHAEQWLLHIHAQIKEKFVEGAAAGRPARGAAQ